MLQKCNGCEKSAGYLDLFKFVRCQRIASKHGNLDYFEFGLFAGERKLFHKQVILIQLKYN
jgi:hypothetical protein